MNKNLTISTRLMLTVRQLHPVYILVFVLILLFLSHTLFVAILVEPNKLETLFRLEPEHIVDFCLRDITSTEELLELINELIRLIGLDELVVSFDCPAPWQEII